MNETDPPPHCLTLCVCVCVEIFILYEAILLVISQLFFKCDSELIQTNRMSAALNNPDNLHPTVSGLKS